MISNLEQYVIVATVVALPIGYMFWLVKRALNEVRTLSQKVVSQLEVALQQPTTPVIFRPLVKCSKCGKPVVRYSTSSDGVHTCINCH